VRGVDHQFEQRHFYIAQVHAGALHSPQPDVTVERASRRHRIGDQMHGVAGLDQRGRGLPDADMGLDPAQQHLAATGGFDRRAQEVIAPAAEAGLGTGLEPFEWSLQLIDRRAKLGGQLLGPDHRQVQQPAGLDKNALLPDHGFGLVHQPRQAALHIDHHQNAFIDYGTFENIVHSKHLQCKESIAYQLPSIAYAEWVTVERMNLNDYNAGDFYDELVTASGRPRAAARAVWKYLKNLDADELAERRAACEVAALVAGITFRVYFEDTGIDRAMPFDLIPRVIPKTEWDQVAAGLEQRVRALNLFTDDLYNDQKIIRDGVVPADLISGSENFREQCRGFSPPLGVWAHICGSDLVRDGDGTVYVLEDNLRIPSGVSYMLENRQVMKRAFPELFESSGIQPVDDYAPQLFEMLASLSPEPMETPNVVVLTPGAFNSAYFEHAYLAQQMGVELVEGRDLVVGDDDCVYMRTIAGPERVDVIYRRVDDAFLDPEVFRPDSMLGVPGLMRAWRNNKVALANAPGSGVADDKVVYAWVPEIIKYYLGEKPKLANVPTWKCSEPQDLKYVLAHIGELVVKPANESGGYGMLIGPRSTKKEQADFKRRIKSDPRNYIAQPTLKLSTCPTFVPGGVGARHVDLRPFILSGRDTFVTTGGLTRVALKAGSLVVNSSQGGGSKDTWIVDTDATGGRR